MRSPSAIPDRRLSWFPVVSCPRPALLRRLLHVPPATGELSAIHHALTRANEVLPRGTETTVLVLADSMLAICTTTGAWAARSNRTLVNKNKRALARLRGKGVDVHFRHYRK